MKNVRKTVSIGAVAALVAGLAAWAQAANNDSMLIKVTMTSDINVEITEAEFQMGEQTGGASVVTSTGATVTNTSSNNREDYSLGLTNPNDWSSVASGAPGFNKYKLQSQFSGTSTTDNSGLAAWSDSDHALTPTPVAASTSQFGDGSANDEGADVLPGQARYLWFKLTMPSASNTEAEQEISVTVTATAG